MFYSFRKKVININEVSLKGIVKDIDMRYLPNGYPYYLVLLSKDNMFFPSISIGKTANEMSEYVRVGDEITVYGKISSKKIIYKQTILNYFLLVNRITYNNCSIYNKEKLL